jgi:hypothetical protein
MYDEATTMFSSMGRYQGGGNAAQYHDRAVINNLFGAPAHVIRETKQDRKKVNMPRYHICVLAHPYFIINLLLNERGQYDDGLLQRFWLISPIPPWLPASVIRSCPKIIIGLHCIFFLIFRIHSKTIRNYTFTIEAEILLDAIFDADRKRVEIMIELDSFFSAIIGKNIIHVVRMCAILKALEYSSYILAEITDSNNSTITGDFMRNVEDFIESVPENAFVIDVCTFKRAEKIVSNLNLTKLILSSYNVDPLGSFDAAFEKIVKSQPKIKLSVDIDFIHLDKKIFSLMKKVFNVFETDFTASILGGTNCSVSMANEVFANLEQLQLGIQDIKPAPGNHIKVNHFYRIGAEELKANAEAGANITKMGLNLTEVIATLEETERRAELKRVTETKKRLRAEEHHEDVEFDHEAPNKKQKYSQSYLNAPVVCNKNGIPFEKRAKKPNNYTNMKDNSTPNSYSPRKSNQILNNITNNNNPQIIVDGDDGDDHDLLSTNTESNSIPCSQLSRSQITIPTNEYDVDTQRNSALNNLTNKSTQSAQNSESNLFTSHENISTLLINEQNNNIESTTSNGDKNPTINLAKRNLTRNDSTSSINLTMNNSNMNLSKTTTKKKQIKNTADPDVETVVDENGKINYYKTIDGHRVKVSKYGTKLGRSSAREISSNLKTVQSSPKTHGMQTRRNSQTESSEPKENTPASSISLTTTNVRHINSIRNKGFNPEHVSTQLTPTNAITQPSDSGFNI